jgi:hypothetical protein
MTSFFVVVVEWVCELILLLLVVDSLGSQYHTVFVAQVPHIEHSVNVDLIDLALELVSMPELLLLAFHLVDHLV